MGFAIFGSSFANSCNRKGFSSLFSQDRCLRIGLFFIVLAIVFWGKNNLSDEAHQDVAGAIIDRGFDITQPISDLILGSKAWLMFFEISSSWCIDLIFLTLFFSWIYNGSSFRLILAYAVYYGSRAVVQAIFVMPYPNGIIWIYPVAPSLVVPFGVTSDFFPSGHVGFCVIAASEFFKKKWFIAMVLCWLTAIYESIVMLSTRNHYTIDLLSGAVMAHYVHMWCHLWSTGWWKVCIDRIVGPYLLYDWGRNPLNFESYKLPVNATPEISSPPAPSSPFAGGGIEMTGMIEP